MTTWFLSDPHFGHRNILKYEPIREFKDTDEMDKAIIDNFNACVSEGDLVFWLGDMFFCNAARTAEIVSQLKPTRNILIRGNHDKGVSNAKFRKLGFEPHRMYLFEEFILTHEPLSKDQLMLLNDYSGTDDYMIKNVCGHLHSEWHHLNKSLYLCVSVENTDFKPISLDEVYERLIQGNVEESIRATNKDS